MGYPKVSTRSRANANAQEERLQALVDDRGRESADGKALTLGDARALGNIAIKSVHVTAAPTAAEHNALIDDMKAICAVLNRMGAKFTGL